MTPEEINVAAFLRLIRFAEHKTDDDNVHFLLYGGRQKFTDVASRHALTFVQKGDLKNAIPLLRKEWASLPGAAQSDMTIERAQ